MSGPIPKRSTERRRRNAIEPGKEVVKAPSLTKDPEWPDPDPAWHPIARSLYLSCQNSGQAQFYEQSDVAMAVYAAEMTHRTLEANRLWANAIVACVDIWGNLLATEGDRRRLRVELERAIPEQPPSVVMLDKYRKAVR